MSSPSDDRPSLLSDLGFRRYWAGQAISAFGDAFAFVAIPLLVLDATGSVAAMGGVSAAVAVTQLATGVVAGQIVDRSDRRRLMIACDIGRLVVTGAVPLLWWLHGPSLLLIYVTLMIATALGNVFSVAYVTATPDLVVRTRLTDANGKLQGSQGLAYVIGPVLAGIVSAKIGTVWAIAIDALTFGVSAISLAGVRFRREGRIATPSGRAMDGMIFLGRQPQLRAITIVFVLLSLLSSGTMAAGVLDVLVYHLRHVQGADDRAVGLSLGLGAVGAVIGAVFAASLRRRFGFGACFIGSTAAQGVALAAMGNAPGTLALGLYIALWTAGMSTRSVVTQTLRQELTPEPLLGRVTSAVWTIAASLAPVGAAVVTRVAERWGTIVAFRGTGVGVLAVTVIACVVILPATRQKVALP